MIVVETKYKYTYILYKDISFFILKIPWPRRRNSQHNRFFDMTHTGEEVDWSTTGDTTLPSKASLRITDKIGEAGTHYWDIPVFGVNEASITDFLEIEYGFPFFIPDLSSLQYPLTHT